LPNTRIPKAEQSLTNRANALSRWAKELDPAAATAPARANSPASWAYWDAKVPPEVTDPVERAKQAARLREAHFARMTAASLRARRLAREAREAGGDAA
jgi:hypothetical protein